MLYVKYFFSSSTLISPLSWLIFNVYNYDVMQSHFNQWCTVPCLQNRVIFPILQKGHLQEPNFNMLIFNINMKTLAWGPG